MEFENLKIKNIEYTIRFSSSLREFSSNNKPWHIIGIQLSGISKHFFKDREFTLSENCLYFMNQKDDYDVETIEKGVAFSVHFTTYEDIDTPSFFVPIRDKTQVLSLLEKIESFYLDESRTLGVFSDFYKLCSFINTQRKKTIPKQTTGFFGQKNTSKSISKARNALMMPPSYVPFQEEGLMTFSRSSFP